MIIPEPYPPCCSVLLLSERPYNLCILPVAINPKPIFDIRTEAEYSYRLIKVSFWILSMIQHKYASS